MRYATTSRGYGLPPPDPTPPAILSVPQPGGGYQYWETPPGYAPPLGDNWPAASEKHPNSIGVASISIGRPIPPGSRMVGSGMVARGSITPMPGIGGELPNLTRSEDGTGALGLGALELGGGWMQSPWTVVGAAAVLVGLVAWKWNCPEDGR